MKETSFVLFSFSRDNYFWDFIPTFKLWYFRFAKRKQEYLQKSPLEKWRYVRQFHSWLGSLVGCAFMDSDYKVTFKTLCPSVLLADYLILLVYTVNLYRNNLVRALMATPAVGIMGPVSLSTRFI